MVSLDRFLIGALISMTAVAYYATAYEAVTKLWIIPSAISAVLFPAFATALVDDRRRAANLYKLGSKYIFVSLFPIVLCVLTVGGTALGLWLGASLATKCAPIMQLLVIGVFANSLAQVPFWHIQARRAAGSCREGTYAGVAALSADLLGFGPAIRRSGCGHSLDVARHGRRRYYVLFSSRLLSDTKRTSRQLLVACVSAAPIFLGAMLIDDTTLKLVFFLDCLCCFLWNCLEALLSPSERQLVLKPTKLLGGVQLGTN